MAQVLTFSKQKSRECAEISPRPITATFRDIQFFLGTEADYEMRSCVQSRCVMRWLVTFLVTMWGADCLAAARFVWHEYGQCIAVPNTRTEQRQGNCVKEFVQLEQGFVLRYTWPTGQIETVIVNSGDDGLVSEITLNEWPATQVPHGITGFPECYQTRLAVHCFRGNRLPFNGLVGRVVP